MVDNVWYPDRCNRSLCPRDNWFAVPEVLGTNSRSFQSSRCPSKLAWQCQGDPHGQSHPDYTIIRGNEKRKQSLLHTWYESDAVISLAAACQPKKKMMMEMKPSWAAQDSRKVEKLQKMLSIKSLSCSLSHCRKPWLHSLLRIRRRREAHVLAISKVHTLGQKFTFWKSHFWQNSQF